VYCLLKNVLYRLVFRMYVYLSDGHRFVLITFLIVNVGNVDGRKNMSSLESADADFLIQLTCYSWKRYLNRKPILMCEQGHDVCNR
jgi:hypothetical protein